jgi:hypothetical protein
MRGGRAIFISTVLAIGTAGSIMAAPVVVAATSSVTTASTATATPAGLYYHL